MQSSKLKELSDVDTEESNDDSSQYEVTVLQVVTLERASPHRCWLLAFLEHIVDSWSAL